MTVSFRLMTPGVENVCGAVHVTFGPLPLNVPASADHVNVSCDAGVSASVTVAATDSASSRSANCAGSLGFDPFATIVLMTGGAFTTYMKPAASAADWPLVVT